MGEKYYVVLKGRKTGIFDEWSGENGCNAQINKYPGAIYKSFDTKEEADNCFYKMRTIDLDTYELTQGKAVLYAAGCFNEQNRKTAYSIILITPGATEYADGIEKYPVLYGKQNGEGELDAVMKGIKLAEEKGCYDILICHSYNGSYAWGTGLWEAKSDGASEYMESVKNAICDVHFATEMPQDNEYMVTVKRIAKMAASK